MEQIRVDLKCRGDYKYEGEIDCCGDERIQQICKLELENNSLTDEEYDTYNDILTRNWEFVAYGMPSQIIAEVDLLESNDDIKVTHYTYTYDLVDFFDEVIHFIVTDELRSICMLDHKKQRLNENPIKLNFDYWYSIDQLTRGFRPVHGVVFSPFDYKQTQKNATIIDPFIVAYQYSPNRFIECDFADDIKDNPERSKWKLINVEERATIA